MNSLGPGGGLEKDHGSRLRDQVTDNESQVTSEESDLNSPDPGIVLEEDPGGRLRDEVTDNE